MMRNRLLKVTQRVEDYCYPQKDILLQYRVRAFLHHNALNQYYPIAQSAKTLI